MKADGQMIDDPIVPELLRSRLEAIGREAGDAVEQTAISPIVTESKDYSVTILDADGSIISATGVIDLHFGAVMHAVCSTIEVHGDSIAAGDVFLANDPHSGGGLHPQDVVIQRPVFVDGERVAWVALAAHMMDMGGMVPGSSAVKATECYQEALRLPPVRLVRQGQECDDIWNIVRINIRSSDLIEMDMRSLVIGASVAEKKLVELVTEMEIARFRSACAALLAGVERVMRERIGQLEDGHYFSTAWIEWGDEVMRMPCNLEVAGNRLIFDLSQAPPQVPFFINSKEYIIRAQLGPAARQLLAPGLPFNQPVLDVIEIVSKPGTLVNCVMPAPIAAAHMDAAMAVATAASQCLQLALHASPAAAARDRQIAPSLSAYGTGRWTYIDDFGSRRVYTLIDGAFCGSPAAADRDGLDIKSNQRPGGNQLEYGDAEILEAAYPLLFIERRMTTGFHGYGRFRSGVGCQQAFQAHDTDTLVGNMTGTRAWFPTAGAAGGYPGATMKFAIRRADGSVEPVGIHQAGVALAPGDTFELMCASGGGFGDPLDRELPDIAEDMDGQRIDRETAEQVYGVIFDREGEIDGEATQARREEVRRERLAKATAAQRTANASVDMSLPAFPLYPGVVQIGNVAVAERSGAVLAVAPDNWLDGCPSLDTPIDERCGGVVSRIHLDPFSGQALFVDVLRCSDRPSIAVNPERWKQAGDAPFATHADSKQSDRIAG